VNSLAYMREHLGRDSCSQLRWSDGPMETGERLARQLQCLLARGRFGPMVLILRGGRRVPVNNREAVRVCHAGSIIEVMIRGGAQEMLFEDLLAIECRPRVATKELQM